MLLRGISPYNAVGGFTLIVASLKDPFPRESGRSEFLAQRIQRAIQLPVALKQVG